MAQNYEVLKDQIYVRGSPGSPNFSITVLPNYNTPWDHRPVEKAEALKLAQEHSAYLGENWQKKQRGERFVGAYEDPNAYLEKVNTELNKQGPPMVRSWTSPWGEVLTNVPLSQIQEIEKNEAAVAAGTMKKVPIGRGYGYAPVTAATPNTQVLGGNTGSTSTGGNSTWDNYYKQVLSNPTATAQAKAEANAYFQAKGGQTSSGGSSGTSGGGQLGNPSATSGLEYYYTQVLNNPTATAAAKAEAAAYFQNKSSGISATNPGSGSGSGSNVPPGVIPSAPTLLPQLVPGTPEYQAALDKLDTSYYDIMMQQMLAQTQEEQQAAQYNWDTFKKQTQETLGVSLQDNALNAWDQIQGLRNQSTPYFSGRNLEGSGLENESIDAYLRSIRRTDASNRTTTANSQEKQHMLYLQSFATPAQIKAFVDSNPELAKSYGFVPSDEIKNSMSYAALKAKYPNMPDDEIKANIASVLDEYGNYRSKIEQKRMVGSNVGINYGNVGTPEYDEYDSEGRGIGNPTRIPVSVADTGVLDIERAKKDWQLRNAPLNNPAAQSGSPIIGQFNSQPNVANTYNNAPQTQNTPMATNSNNINVPQNQTTAGTGAMNPSVQKNTTSATPAPASQQLKGTDQVPQSIVDQFNNVKAAVNKYLSTMAGTNIKK